MKFWCLRLILLSKESEKFHGKIAQLLGIELLFIPLILPARIVSFLMTLDHVWSNWVNKDLNYAISEMGRSINDSPLKSSKTPKLSLRKKNLSFVSCVQHNNYTQLLYNSNFLNVMNTLSLQPHYPIMGIFICLIFHEIF